MKTLDRYLAREHWIPVSYCLIAFSMVFVICDLFGNLSRLLEAQTPFSLVLRYYGCVLAVTMEYLVPASLLLGTLYTLWRLARHNELTAMRASGIGLLRVMRPFLATGLVFTALAAAVKEGIAPPAGVWAADLSKNRFRMPKQMLRADLPYYNRAGYRLWLIGSIDLRDPRRLLRVKLTQERPNGTRLRDVYAEKVEWLDGEWWFYGTRFQDYDEQDNPIGGLAVPDRPRQAAIEIPRLNERPTDFTNEVRDWELLSSVEMLRYFRAHPNLSGRERATKESDLHRRFAMPWACLIVTLFAMPAGARGGRHNPIAAIFTAIALFLGFYGLTQLGVLAGKTRIVEPWLGAWFSNIVFFVAGVGMLGRMR